MKQEPAPRSHGLAALFAAAAFLPTPLFAQDTSTQPPVTNQQTPPVLSDPSPPVTTTPPVVTQPPPVAETPPVQTAPPQAATPAPARREPLLTGPLPADEPAQAQTRERTGTRAARTARTTPRAAPRARAEAPAGVAAPAAGPDLAPAPEAAAPQPLPPEAIPAEDAPPAAAAPAPVADAGETATPAQDEGGGASWLWLLAGAALLLGALAFFARRRRRQREEAYEHGYEPAHHAEPALAAAPMAHHEEHHEAHRDTREEEVHEPIHAPAATPIAAVAGGAGAAAAAPQGRPWIELLMRPVRAGVDGTEARVEFELSVDNHGSATARDVRVSTWMFPAGAAQQSEMERMLIERPPAALPEVTLDPGEARRIATAVALPTSGLSQDAVLPVVVADARYVLPDGSEGHTSVSFAVGVPDGEELAHFAIDNPSGLHDGVEARPLGEPERV